MNCRSKSLAWVVLSLFIGIVYGFAVGKYDVFPYGFIKSAKQIFVKDGGHNERNAIYRNRSEMLSSFHSRHDIAMFGDSFIEYGMWQELLNVDVANLGIAGDDTSGMIDRIDQVYSVTPSKVFVSVGINDIDKNKSVDEIYNNILKINTALQEKGITVFINTVVFSGSSKEKRNHLIADLNKLIYSGSKDNKYKVVDINDVIAPHGEMLKRYSSDDTHINPSGYAVWTEAIKRIMK